MIRFLPHFFGGRVEMAALKTDVIDLLEGRKIPYKIKYHQKPVFTSEDAAIERGVKLSQIVKTLLLGDGDFIIVAVLPSHRRLDVKKIKKLTGRKNLQFMGKELIEQKTGLIVGAVAPIGSGIEGIPVFVDPSVFHEELLDISSGDPNAGLELHRDDLKFLLSGATLIDITKEEK
jgi:Cys-tRNA(Pro)/Cys-tRNA(Cys) deacylase